MAKKYTGLNLAQVQVPETIDTTGLSKGILKAEQFKYEEKERKKKEALDFLKPESTFKPYQQAANKMLTDAINEIMAGGEYDPAKAASIAVKYNEAINIGKALENNLNEVSTALKSDKEIKSDLAIPALYKQYVKSGNLDELYNNASQPIDASQLISQAGGSQYLNVDDVLKNRLSTIGEITKKVIEQGDWQTVAPGLKEAEVKDTLTKAASIVGIDASGNPYIDLTSDLANTAMGVMLSDDRVRRIVDDRLLNAGINQPTENQRKEELKKVLAPYASISSSDSTSVKTARYTVGSTSGSGYGSGSAYANMWMPYILSGDPALEQEALEYIKGGMNYSIANIPDSAIIPEIEDYTEKVSTQNEFFGIPYSSTKDVTKQSLSFSDRNSLLNKFSARSNIVNAEIINGSDFSVDPSISFQGNIPFDPNQKYVHLKIEVESNRKIGNLSRPEIKDVFIPLKDFVSPTISAALYEAGKRSIGEEFGLRPGIVPAKKTQALGGEIDVDTKFSDYQGTETVKDLIGGFAYGGEIKTSVFDLIKNAGF